MCGDNLKGCEPVETPETEFNSRIAGVCKECGNGTLNNDRLPAFRFIERESLELFGEQDDACYVCMACGSDHVNVVVL
jgi:hypothetical protein